MFSSMDQIIFLLLLLLLLASFFANPSTTAARSPPARSTARHSSRITVVGAVYCDTCSSSAFTKHSYFLPGVDVQIRCKFKVNSPKSTEQVNYSVNRTTNRYGVYKLDIPSVDGVNCINGLALVSMCQATLIDQSSSPAYCSVPALRTTSNEISIKSEQDNLCIYSLNALSYKPSKRNTTLCGNKKEELENSLNSSKCFFPWPPLPSFNFPPLPPLSSLPFPSLPWPFQFPPSLPFPFPSLPPFPPTTTLFSPPPPPAFSLSDPRTWIPYNPPSPPAIPYNKNQNP